MSGVVAGAGSSSRDPSPTEEGTAGGDLPAIAANPDQGAWVPHLHSGTATRGRGERGRRADLPPLALAGCVSLCALPFIFLLVTPWFGFRAALGTALAVVAGITVLCWLLCAAARLPDERR